MKKKVIGAVIVSLVLLIGIGSWIFCKVKENSFIPEDTLNKYISLLNKNEYKEMYKLLTNESKKTIKSEDYITRNKNIYEGIEASNIKIKIKKVDKKDSIATVFYETTMNTIAGKYKFDNNVIIEKDKGLNWSSEMIFPELTDKDKVRVSTIKAKRGTIYDRSGQALAKQGISASVGLVPGKLGDNKEENIKKVSEILGVSTEYINKELGRSYVKDDTFVPLKEIAANDGRVKELLTVPGVLINDKEARVYPYGEKAAHLTGYVQAVTAEDIKKNPNKGYTESSIIGRVGLEKYYDDKLRGDNGADIYIIDSEGNKKTKLISKEVKDGQDIKLTIDMNTQIALYNELSADKGCGVAMNSNTGEVLALVSTPSYDPNKFVLGLSTDEWNSLNNDPKLPLLSRFQNTSVPGSVFKPIIAAIGLEDKVIDPNANKNIKGLKWQKDKSWGEYFITRTSEYSEDSNLLNAIAYSDNIYFAQAALDIGEDKLISKFKELGFGDKIPFDYGLYNSQITSDKKMKNEIQLADTGYGQGEVLVNPIHLASIYTSFINNGNMVKPYINSEDGHKIWKEKVFSQDTVNTVLEDMKSVVTKGTAKDASVEGLSIAGKTGTAEIKKAVDDNSGTELGWFIGMSTSKPSDNILVLSMIEDVKDRGGSHYVVPKVTNVLNKYK